LSVVLHTVQQSAWILQVDNFGKYCWDKFKFFELICVHASHNHTSHNHTAHNHISYNNALNHTGHYHASLNHASYNHTSHLFYFACLSKYLNNYN
jgi:hypothetical protein